MAVVSLEAEVPPAKREFNTDYFLTPPGILRIAEGVLSLAALISIAEGYCGHDTSRYVFLLFVVIVTMLQAICIIALFFMKLDEHIKSVDISLIFLVSDGLALIFFFISSTLALLSIGRCEYLKFARLIAALFVLSLFLVSVGLNYLNYLLWQQRMSEKESGKTSTITESSPTVLT